MLSMILQLFGLVKLIIGILTAAEAGLLADIEIEDGKLDF
jgi:hypothetical protein